MAISSANTDGTRKQCPPKTSKTPVASWKKFTPSLRTEKKLPPRPATPAPKLRHIAEAAIPLEKATEVGIITIKALASDIYPVGKSSADRSPLVSESKVAEQDATSETCWDLCSQTVQETTDDLCDRIDQAMEELQGDFDEIRKRGRRREMYGSRNWR